LEELLPKDNENIRLPFIGPVVPNEPEGFRPDQMVRCDECLRANPPTRVACLYCGAALLATEELQRLRKPTLRRPDKHQLGYNNIYLPTESTLHKSETIQAAADLLKMSIEELGKVVRTQSPLPVARTVTRDEAELIHARLAELNLSTLILSDPELMPKENSIARVRALSVDHSGFTIIQSAASDTGYYAWTDVVLIVSGRLIQKKVELTERKSRRSENEIVSSSEFHSDEAVIDLYLRDSLQTWRIVATGFDFSCLGDEKSLVANENIGRLLKLLSQNCSSAVFDDLYWGLRQTLEPVWPPEQETSSRGWRRERPGQVNLSATTVESNEAQFSRYSRLRFHFCRSK
jgi:hypothetical protein